MLPSIEEMEAKVGEVTFSQHIRPTDFWPNDAVSKYLIGSDREPLLKGEG
jgi:hypothetical protein